MVPPAAAAPPAPLGRPLLGRPSALDAAHAVVLAGGGLAGLIRAGSVASLLGGVAAGLAQAFAASRWVKSLFSLALAVVMGRRIFVRPLHNEKQSVGPAGGGRRGH